MSFRAVRLTKDYRMHVPARMEEVFPLLCPVREREWLPYWRCNILYSESGRAEAGCVFETHFSDRWEMTWLVTKYDPPGAIQYTVFKPESHVWTFDILLAPEGAGYSQLLWRHTFTGLTPEGNQYLIEYTEEKHRSHLGLIERALVHYIKTGRIIDQ